MAIENPATLLFRTGGDEFGANAMAIPNNTIILTDEIVEMLDGHDGELLAVLAHEQAHIFKKHSIQQFVSSIGTLFILTTIATNISDVVVKSPIALILNKYSQDYEYEADRYAVELLKRNNKDPLLLVNFLTRVLAEEEEQPQHSMDFLSSHPDTAKRIQMIHTLVND